MIGVAGLVDAALELPIGPSFTRLGYETRSRLEHWRPLRSYDMAGQTVLLTGATSGLGLAAARQMAGCGASLILLGRDEAKTERVRTGISTQHPHATVTAVTADMGDLHAVRRVAGEVRSAHGRLDVLVHNAGTLEAHRGTTSDGTEATVASQVVGPFLLTGLLLDLLAAAGPGRVLTMSSGGMYSAALTVGGLEMDEASYGGAEQYARAKRAQVTLNEIWAERMDGEGVVFHSVHPGWADTPGVERSLPRFHALLGPVLRTPEQGADTLVWLAADPAGAEGSGGFWLDRRRRPIHRLPATRRSDTPERRTRLWDWCVERSGIDAALLGL